MNKKTTHSDTEVIFGIHPIIELLKAKKRKLLTIYTTKPLPKVWNSLAPLLPKNLPIQYVPRESLHKLANSQDHQGIVGFASPFVIRKKMYDPAKQPFLLMLDGIQDTGNLGAILRSAYCTNINGIIIVKKGGAPLSATTLKASAGLAEHLDIMIISSAQAAAHELKKAGYNLYLAVLQKGTNATTVSYKTPLCLVIGSESGGISHDIRKEGTLITLPQKEQDISYNASVAAGILLFLIAQHCHKI